MGLRFLADHCISNRIIRTLRDTHHEVVRLRDLLPVESPDAIVIAQARELGAILSLNGDFADIVTYPPRNYKGIVALQVRNHGVLEPTRLSNQPTTVRVLAKAQLDFRNL